MKTPKTAKALKNIEGVQQNLLGILGNFERLKRKSTGPALKLREVTR